MATRIGSSTPSYAPAFDQIPAAPAVPSSAPSVAGWHPGDGMDDPYSYSTDGAEGPPEGDAPPEPTPPPPPPPEIDLIPYPEVLEPEETDEPKEPDCTCPPDDSTVPQPQPPPFVVPILD